MTAASMTPRMSVSRNPIVRKTSLVASSTVIHRLLLMLRAFGKCWFLHSTPISAGRKSMTTLGSFLKKNQQIPIFQEGSVIDLSARIRDFAVSKIDTDKRRNCTWQGGFR